MRLALSTLTEKLPEDFGAKLRDFSDGTTLYDRPVLYEAGMPFEEGVLYLARASALPKVAPDCNCAVICVGGVIPWQRTRRHIPLLHISREPNLTVVFNAIQAVYNACDHWDASMRDEVEKSLDFDIDAMLILGARFLGRQINVVNQNLQTILHTMPETGGDTADVAVSHTMSPLNTEVNERIKEVCRLERQLRKPYFSALEINGKSYCNNLYPFGHFAGCVSITDDGVAFTDGELPLIDHFFGIFQKAYSKYLRSYGTNERDGLEALRNVLNHAPLSRRENELLALAPDEQWCCFRLKERRGGNTLPNDYMHATLSGIFPKVVYATMSGQAIVGLIRMSRSTSLAIDPRFADIGDEIHRMGYYAGVSNAFDDLADFDLHLLQAEFAVNRATDADRPLHFFHDYALSYLLDVCSSEMPVDAVVGQGLRNLMAYDEAHGAELMHTLDVFLRNESGVSQTARDLYIHRSSLLKRLERIWGILGDRLEDPNHRLYYRLCLALLRRE